jgi:hypothetical protein
VPEHPAVGVIKATCGLTILPFMVICTVLPTEVNIKKTEFIVPGLSKQAGKSEEVNGSADAPTLVNEFGPEQKFWTLGNTVALHGLSFEGCAGEVKHN